MEIGQRTPRVECPDFLAFVRLRPCCRCGRMPAQAAHIRMACLERGKKYTGKQQKPDDRWCVPLCQGCHLDDPDAQHRGSEAAFWKGACLDPFLIATRHWEEFLEAGGSEPKPRARKATSKPAAKVRGPKRKWASRPMQSRNSFR